MWQQGIPGESLTVDPRDLVAPPSGTGLFQDFGTTGNLQLGYDINGYPQSSAAGHEYLNPTNLDLSGDGMGRRD